jgi:hypothetical protein
MEVIYQLIFIFFVGFCIRVADAVCRKSFVEILLASYLTFSGSVVAAGLILNHFDLTDDRRFWSWAVFIPAFVLFIQFSLRFAEKQDQKTIFQLVGSRIQYTWGWYRGLPPLTTIGFSAMFVIWAFFSWLHLAYMPTGTVHFSSESQEVLEKFCYLMSGKREAYKSLPVNLAYWITGFAILGIVQRLVGSFTLALYSALITWSLQIILSEFFNLDAIFISWVASVIFFLANFKQSLRRRYLYLAGLTMALAFGHDNIFGKLLPIVLGIMAYTVFWDKAVADVFFSRFRHLLVGGLIGCLIFIPHHFNLEFFIFGGSFLLTLLTLALQASVALRVSDSSAAEFLLVFFLLWVGTIIPSGFILSYFSKIHLFWAWSALTFLISFVGYHVVRNTKLSSVEFQPLQLSDWFSSLSKYEQVLMWMLFLTVAACQFVNIPLLLYTVPNEWDSMTGHLMKVGYYLQNHNMNRVYGTNWSIDFYPKSLPTIQIYSFLWLDSTENALKLVHYFSYWIGALAVYGITKRIFNDMTAAFFAGLVFAILPIVLVQATTTETDLVLTAYLGLITYFAFSYYQLRQRRYLVLTAVALCVALSHKITVLLLLPSLGTVILFCVLEKTRWVRNVSIMLATGLVCLVIYVLPTGYLENFQTTGQITAPKAVMDYHGTNQYSKAEILKYGTKNVGRYAFDFFHLDGLRNIKRGEILDEKMRASFVPLGQKLNLDENTFQIIEQFRFKQIFPFHLERPYWGVISFGLILPLVLLIFFRRIRKMPMIILTVASILYYLALSYSAPYDPIKGRYFMNMAIFALPLMGIYFGKPLQNSVLLRNYVLFVVLIACVSALVTLGTRMNAPLFGQNGKPSIFKMSRTEQMTLARPDVCEAYIKFEEIVPKDATVALATMNEDFEYPLFGRNFSRKLIPLHPFHSEELKPIPEQAQYLFFNDKLVKPLKTDIRLNAPIAYDPAKTRLDGSVFYLRKLK